MPRVAHIQKQMSATHRIDLLGRQPNLRQDVAVRDVVPEFDDLAVLDAKDVDEREGHRVAGGRNAQQHTLMRPAEAR